MTNINRYLTGFMIGFILHTIGTYIQQEKNIVFPIIIMTLYLLITILDCYPNKKNL